MKRYKIQNYFSINSYLELFNDIIYGMTKVGDQIIYSFDEYIPSQYIQDLLKYNEHYPIYSDKYNNLWKVVNIREDLKDICLQDFLVEFRIIGDMNINEWKYKIHVVEEIDNTNLEIVANNSYELQVEAIEEILRRYDA
ncbi:hypothetical protein [Paenibacillus wynnii]|uniref:Uncharacterized protein n=1 Tax=Paenibacillus wynnii TaxID=268407 RepID=A0A098M3I1_9BACL|nr:hypothetical protein [Paenibacillus wynnii]KGE17074.1 hypothetical protein PWYN_20670 [Paenibacillus wynnii]